MGTRHTYDRRHAAVALLLVVAGLRVQPAAALDFTLLDGEITGTIRTQIGVGAAVRTQNRDPALVGKLNLPGQEQFCEDKPLAGAPGINCLNEAGNAAYLALPGYPSANTDDGDLNYEQGDFVSAGGKIAPRLQLSWGAYGLDLTGLYFYDGINTGFTESHPNNEPDNNGFQPRHTSRDAVAEDKVGTDLRLLDAYVSGTLPISEAHPVSFKLGEQILSIGTSTTMVFNSLNVVNPPDANLRFLPYGDLREVFQRIPMAVVGAPVTESLAVEGFYAFGWKPIVVPPSGTFFSVNDILGATDPYVMLQFGKFREDPQNRVGVEERTQANVNQLSDAGRTLYFNGPREPGDGGEYGLTLSYFAEQLNNTSFSLTYLNLHSRFPIVSFVASQYGCAHESTDAATATVDCEGFKTEANMHCGLEVIPLDTVRLYLDYPENVHALGTAFSTNLGDVAWTGEVVFRDNQPLQVDPTDVGFAALQPIFPEQSILIAVTPTANITIPARNVAVPDYLSDYRGQVIQPGQLVPGYERFKTLAYNTSLLVLLGASDNPFGADQLTTLLEVGAYQILDLPPLDQLQIAAPGVFFHHSAGVDSTGTPNAQQTTFPATPSDRLNPSYQAGGFATEFSWGYRVLGQLSFEDVLPGLKLLPQWSFFHDVDGKSPLPSGEFVERRKQAMLGLSAGFEGSWNAAVRYNWFFGAGQSNALGDRDNLALNVSYDF
jgi:hypothetical protein